MNFGSLRQRWATLTRTQQIAMIVVGGLILLGIAASAQSGRGLLSPSHLLAVATIVFVAFPVHEFAHAAAAVALGDETPRRQGRYTLNPIAHIDIVGAILILVAGFGWAKPVQWNPNNINVDRRLGAIIVAAAGPLSNLLLAALAAAMVRVLDNSFVENFLFDFIWLNAVLFVFNLIPIPPLDGSHILFALLPGNTFNLQMQLRQYGFLILLLVMFVARDLIFAPAIAIVQLLL